VALGLCDTATGLLLIASPSWTLRLMRVPQSPVETVYLRWVGVFVCSVGLFYLYPFLLGNGARRRTRLAVVFEVTALARVAVAAFVVAGMAAGALVWQWASVAVTDLLVASIQIVLLGRGVWSDDRV